MEKKNYTISEASELLKISEATCRNWIKSKTLEYMEIDGKKYISSTSIKKLLDNKLNGRLSSRRNKTKKDGNILSINYLSEKKSQEFIVKVLDSLDNIDSIDKIRFVLKECARRLMMRYDKMNSCGEKLLNELYIGDTIFYNLNMDVSNTSISDDILGALYMCLKQEKDRKTGGMYYTPAYVVDGMYTELIDKIEAKQSKTIIDICCGTGNFLIKALENGFAPNNIYGNDFDDISVVLSKINMFIRSNLTYDDLNEQFSCQDSLFANFKQYDICIGNPPWGSEISIDFEKISKTYTVAKTKSIDPFCLFIEKGINITKPGGYLFYVCPEALCNVGIHKSTREYLIKNTKLCYLSYLGNAFDGVQSPAITICFEKCKNNDFASGAIIHTLNETYVVENDRPVDAELWDFNISTSIYSLVNKLCHFQDAVYLKGNAKFALGIVTGDNKKYVLSSPTSKTSNLVKGSNVYKYHLQIGDFYLEYERDKFQQVAPDEMYFAKEKLIYRFISDTLVFTYDDKQTLSLNSANICIPQLENIPMKYVLAILNSRVAHFIFKLRFNSIKILRNHIESIPIPVASEKKTNLVIEYVDKLLGKTNDDKEIELYNKLDEIIMDIFLLKDIEKETISNFNKNNIFLYE